MPVDQFHKLLMQVAKASNHNGMSERDGYVHEVKGDKMRAVIGIKPDGSPMLSPWTSTSDHRGGSRERNQYVKGQNVRLSAPGGDYRQATLSPGAHSKSFPAPAHADQINGDSYQAGKLRVSSNRTGGDQGGQGGQGGGGGGQQQGGGEHFHDIWIAEEDDNPPQHQDQSGQPESGGGGGSQGQQQQGGQQSGSGGKPAMKMRVSEKGYITARVGEGDDAMRFATHKEGVKLSFGKNKNTIFVNKDGCYSTKPIEVKECKIPDDDN